MSYLTGHTVLGWVVTGVIVSGSLGFAWCLAKMAGMSADVPPRDAVREPELEKRLHKERGKAHARPLRDDRRSAK